jgi:hypothetical protein
MQISNAHISYQNPKPYTNATQNQILTTNPALTSLSNFIQIYIFSILLLLSMVIFYHHLTDSLISKISIFLLINYNRLDDLILLLLYYYLLLIVCVV